MTGYTAWDIFALIICPLIVIGCLIGIACIAGKMFIESRVGQYGTIGDLIRALRNRP